MTNKKMTKRIVKIAFVLMLLFTLTSCVKVDPVTNEPLYISLDTTLADLSEQKSGIFDIVLTYPLAQAINFLSSKVGVFWGIVAVTLIINLILLAFTFKSSESMQKMQMIQPEIDRIQKKYEGQDSQAAKAQMSQEMQRVFDKNGVNPLAGFASLLQLPIFLCMYAAIRRSYAVAHGSVLGTSLEITPREGFANGQVVIIVIYVCMIVFQLLSTLAPQIIASIKRRRLAKIQHKPYVKAQNNNMFMMYGMVLIIGFAMLTWPTAISLYYAIVSIINILKTLAVEVISQRKEAK